MSKCINYNGFLELIEKYKNNFSINVLKAMYDEFGEEQINKYFNYRYQNLDESDALIFYKNYYAYFETQISVINESDNNIINCENDDIVKCLINNASVYPLMDYETEKEHGINLDNGKNNLTIINEVSDYMLYPDLYLEKIFLSVKNLSDLELVKKIKKISFTLKDESIFSKENVDIKKFISLSNNKILSLDELKTYFPNLSFNNVSGVDDLKTQVDILDKYVTAKFNFYNRNLRLVIWIAKKGVDNFYLADKIQEGNLGLVKAINRYSCSKGYRFTTYATFWIKQAVFRFVEDNVHTIRRPVYLSEHLKKYKKYVDDYRSTYGVTPSVKECSKALKYDEEKILNLRSLSLGVLSLDANYNEFDENELLADRICDDSASFEDVIISNSVVFEICNELKNVLNDRSYDILMARLGFDGYDHCYTLKEIGDKLGLTRERVRQIEFKSMKVLKNIAKRKGLY